MPCPSDSVQHVVTPAHRAAGFLRLFDIKISFRNFSFAEMMYCFSVCCSTPFDWKLQNELLTTEYAGIHPLPKPPPLRYCGLPRVSHPALLPVTTLYILLLPLLLQGLLFTPGVAQLCSFSPWMVQACSVLLINQHPTACGTLFFNWDSMRVAQLCLLFSDLSFLPAPLPKSYSRW